jgi:hypothetical protein
MESRFAIASAFFTTSFIALILFTSSLPVSGQNIRRFSTDGTTAPALEPGAAAGSYALSGFDNVSLFNGNLNFAMPLLKMGGRGSASYSLGLKIEKNGASRLIVHLLVIKPVGKVIAPSGDLLDNIGMQIQVGGVLIPVSGRGLWLVAGVGYRVAHVREAVAADISSIH